ALDDLQSLGAPKRELAALRSAIELQLGYEIFAAVDATKIELSSAMLALFSFHRGAVDIDQQASRRAFEVAIAPLLTRVDAASAPTRAAPTAPGGRAPAAPASAAPTSALDALRAKGTLVVAIRVEAPPPDRNAGDPAHAQKRAFEAAVALILAQRILGPNAK